METPRPVRAPRASATVPTSSPGNPQSMILSCASDAHEVLARITRIPFTQVGRPVVPVPVPVPGRMRSLPLQRIPMKNLNFCDLSGDTSRVREPERERERREPEPSGSAWPRVFRRHLLRARRRAGMTIETKNPGLPARVVSSNQARRPFTSSPPAPRDGSVRGLPWCCCRQPACTRRTRSHSCGAPGIRAAS